MKLSSLNVIGYKNQQVPNTFITQPDPTEHLGIVLPGYRHSVDMPDLHYAGRILLDQGADLLRVEYVYYQTDFISQAENIQDEWLSSDVFTACNAALSYRPYKSITLVGKSLGTIAMGHLLADSRFRTSRMVTSTVAIALPARWSCVHNRRDGVSGLVFRMAVIARFSAGMVFDWWARRSYPSRSTPAESRAGQRYCPVGFHCTAHPPGDMYSHSQSRSGCALGDVDLAGGRELHRAFLSFPGGLAGARHIHPIHPCGKHLESTGTSVVVWLDGKAGAHIIDSGRRRSAGYRSDVGLLDGFTLGRS